MPKALFSRKPDTLETLLSDTSDLLRLFGNRAYSEYAVCSEIELTQAEWDVFTRHLWKRQDWIAAFSEEQHSTADEVAACIRVSTPGAKIKLIVDPQGSSCAHYVAIEFPAASKSDAPSPLPFVPVDPPVWFSPAAKAAYSVLDDLELYKIYGTLVFTDDILEYVNPTGKVDYCKYEFSSLDAFESWLLDCVAEWLTKCPEMAEAWQKHLAFK